MISMVATDRSRERGEIHAAIACFACSVISPQHSGPAMYLFSTDQGVAGYKTQSGMVRLGAAPVGGGRAEYPFIFRLFCYNYR